MTTTRDVDVDFEPGEYVLVGHILKFQLVFGVNWFFLTSN